MKATKCKYYARSKEEKAFDDEMRELVRRKGANAEMALYI